MKKITRITLLSASLGVASQAAPFMAIGDGAELFLTGTLGVRADDNILLASNKDDDLIFDLAPGIDLTFGKNAQLQGSLTMSHTWSNYSDHSALNTNLFNGDFVSKYDDGKLKLGLNVGFHELNQNTVDIRPTIAGLQSLVRRDVFTTGANAEVEVSQITSIGGGVDFRHENYKVIQSAGFTDSDVLEVPLNFYYKWTPKMDLSVGYRYRDTAVDSGFDSNDHYFNVGARGEFTPKLTGKFTLGLNNRRLDGAGDESGLGLDASFAYEISPKTSLQFGASNDFGTSPQGQQQENFTINGMVTTKISEEWSLLGGLSFRSIDYERVSTLIPARTDDYWEAQLGTSYTINANVRLLASYVYRKYETGTSRLSGSDFENNVFSVAANFRY